MSTNVRYNHEIGVKTRWRWLSRHEFFKSVLTYAITYTMFATIILLHENYAYTETQGVGTVSEILIKIRKYNYWSTTYGTLRWSNAFCFFSFSRLLSLPANLIGKVVVSSSSHDDDGTGYTSEGLWWAEDEQSTVHEGQRDAVKKVLFKWRPKILTSCLRERATTTWMAREGKSYILYKIVSTKQCGTTSWVKCSLEFSEDTELD